MPTCQICARDIKAARGTIAHHGYKRPDRGSGWQTPSCMGAKFAPYEQSRERIPYVLALINSHIVRQQEYYALLEDKQVKVPHRKYLGNGRHETIMLEPSDPLYYRAWAYEKSQVHFDIQNSECDRDKLQKRYDDWIAPEEQEKRERFVEEELAKQQMEFEMDTVHTKES